MRIGYKYFGLKYTTEVLSVEKKNNNNCFIILFVTVGITGLFRAEKIIAKRTIYSGTIEKTSEFVFPGSRTCC